ncbi:MAG: TIGR00730 family Rossman fold protein [Verrucomicrobiota bacterium]
MSANESFRASPIRVTVYLASSNDIAEKYFEVARELGGSIAKAGMRLVYGGGSSGLMGAVADAALQAGGAVTGVIPTFMKEREWAHHGLSEMIEVDTMHERKTAMVAQCDAIIALPGGCGTFEELLEAITWRRLELIHKPIIIFNQDNYYDPLIALLDRSIEEGFMKPEFADYWRVSESVPDALEFIKAKARGLGEFDKSPFKSLS